MLAGAFMVVAGTALAVADRWRRRSSIRPDLLADECREFAEELEIFADSRRHEPAVKSNTLAGGWRTFPNRRTAEDNADDGGHARLLTFQAETRRMYQEEFRRSALQIFDRLGAADAVDTAERGQFASPSSPDEIARIAERFREYAERLTPLADRVVRLVREGLRLQEEIEARPLAVKASSGNFVADGRPHADLEDRVLAFRERSVALLRDQGDPTLLPTFERGANAFLQAERDGGPRQTNDWREAFSLMQQLPLLVELHACLYGLAAVRDALGR
jgi:hypothetical protein